MAEQQGQAAKLCVIGVDVGTTSIKTLAFDGQGRELARNGAQQQLIRNAPGAAEQDPRAVYDAVTDALAATVRQVIAQGYRVARLGISAAMHSLLPVGADDQPLGPALTWMDTRPAAAAQALWASPQGQALYQRTGTPIHAMSPLAKLIWARTAQPELFQRAARWVSLKEWLWHGWLGAWQVDASIASATGLYNLRAGTWDGEALALAGIDAARLSSLAPTTFVGVGLREPRLLAAGLMPQTPFVIGASDGVLANLGAGAIQRDVMALTLGTSCAVRVGGDQPLTDPRMRSFCYVLDSGRFILGGPSNSGGDVLDWLYHQVLHRRPSQPAIPPRQTPAQGWDDANDGFGAMLTAAGQIECGELLCLPYIAGERAPLWDADARGVFFGLSSATQAEHLMRAAIEGVILNAYWIATGLFETLGKPRQISASGKLLETEWIRQLTADVFGLPVGYLGAVDASTLGAVALADIACGARTWDDITQHPPQPVSVAQPHAAAHAIYQRKYASYRRLCDTLLGAFGSVGQMTTHGSV
ncbi:MAG: gluconokinase [Ktedonobacterales bacterium]